MRIEELWLDAFGPFTKARVKLAPARLNVIYGPNEAGKSTSLRAIEALLFEIEEKTRDDHLHKKDKLRVGGVLTTKSGARFALSRRKGRGRTVLHPESGDPIDDAPLAAMLGGVTREVFRAVYGLDHARLSEGGRNLAEGKGLVGESLFAASTGVAHLHALSRELEESAIEIYTPRGHQRALNAELEAYEKALEEVELGATSARAVDEARADLERRRRDRDELRERKRLIEAERAKLVRVRNVRPYLVELPLHLAELARRGEPRPVDPALREQMERALDAASPAAERLEAELLAAKAERAEVPLDMRALAYKIDIEELFAHRSAHLRARAERDKLLERAAIIEAALEQKRAEPPIDLAAIEAVIRRAKGVEAREAQLAELESSLAEDEREARAELAALGLELDLEAATRLAVPSIEAIDAREEREAPRAERVKTLERAAAAQEERARALEDELLKLRASSRAPLEEDLEEARRERDALVDALPETKPQALARAIAEADRVVDRMRADAESVSRLALLGRELEAAKKALAQGEPALVKARAELAALRAKWTWREGDASELRAWVRRFEAARALCHAIARKTRKASEERAALAIVREELGAQTGSLADALERLRDRHRKLERAALAREGAIEKLEHELASVRERIMDIERDAGVWESRVAALLRATTSNFAPEDLAGALGEVHERLMEAERHRTTGAELDKRIARVEKELEAERRRIAEARGALDRLIEAAGAADARELRRFEEEAREIQGIRAQRDRALLEIARLGEGRSHEELARESLELTGEIELGARLAEIDLVLEQLAADLEQATTTVTKLELGMKQFEEPLDQAARARERAEVHLARAKELTQRYLRARLAHKVLERAMERLREAAQGPVILRASAIFEKLTRGSFTRLAVELDESERPRLKAVRPGGAEVEVAGMSDGTRDQLYLALRVASLERMAESGDPLPLVLDDALVHFDEDRARAALGVLGELAHQMQVLLFTHHERTALIAREAVPDVVLAELRPRVAAEVA